MIESNVSLAMRIFPLFLLILSFVLPCAVAQDEKPKPKGKSASSGWGAAFGKGSRKLPEGQNSEAKPSKVQPPVSRPLAAPASPKDRAARAAAAQAEADARSLVVTFAAAVEAKTAGFNGMTSAKQAVGALATGVRGGGKLAAAVFQVPGLTPERQGAAIEFLRIDRGMLVFASPPSARKNAPAAKAKKDDRVKFAKDRMLLRVPAEFSPQVLDNGDLLLRGDGATINVHLAALEGRADAWAAVRKAADESGLGISMAGGKVYFIDPDRRNPEKVTIGFKNAVVEMRIKGEPGSPGAIQVRFALAALVESLDVVPGK